MKDLFQYKTEFKDFSAAKFISAPADVLESYSKPKNPEFPQAKFIWPMGLSRFHACRLFTPKGKVKKVEASFSYDSLFDLWLNGKQFAFETSYLPLTDITDLLVEGENNLHLRGYQTLTYKSSFSAFTGGLRITYENGEVEEIVTDTSFRAMQFVTFWEIEEKEGFETALPNTRQLNRDMFASDLYPTALRRSFIFSRTFDLEKMPVKATLFASAHGCYEPYLNSKRISDSFFMPFYHVEKKEYQEFDILPLLQTGSNTIGMISGNGWLNCASWGAISAYVPKMIAIVELVYEDGTTEKIYTDESWRAQPSPLTENDLQYGERYDARLEIEGWCAPVPNTENSFPVLAEENEKYTSLLKQSYPPVKKAKEHAPRLLKILPDGSPLYDIGVCVSGRMRIKLKDLKPGQDVRIRYCERLTDDEMPENGSYTTVFYQNDCAPDGKTPYFMRNLDVYTAKGEKEETYECRFSYTGYRYIWVEGLESTDNIVEIVPFELYTALDIVGSIETENKPVKAIFNATMRSWLNNIMNGPTDCPTREKNYWNGDAQIFSHTACWFTDNSRFLSRWAENGKKMGGPEYGWDDEKYELPLTLYRFYGDKEILRATYPKILNLLKARTLHEDMIIPDNPAIHEYNDWLSPTWVFPPVLFYQGCWYCHMLDEVAKIADILEDFETAKTLREKLTAAKAEFNKLYLTDDGTDYTAHCQCGIVLPLAFGIAPEENREALANTLVEYIKKEDYHLTTGFIGSRFLPEVLADYGHKDVVYKLIAQDTFPSWLNMFDGGATAITESWLGHKDPDKSLSMCHFSLGTITGWFFEYLGGIRVKECAPGFTHIVLKPHPIEEIGSFAVKYNSCQGEIYTEWHYENGKPVFSYKVPEGITVEVEIR